MALPSVNGWLVDFRTARSIFLSGSNERISHCVGLCASSKLYICHCEEDAFKSLQVLREPFLDENKCIFEPDEDIFDRCIAVSAHPNGKACLIGNEAAIFITAIALAKNFGVITDHRSPPFQTAYDLCKSYGIPVFSADEYFHHI
jgi:hypothetical protein